MDGKKFVEIKKPVEEVREIENQGSKVIEKLEEIILPTAHASDKDEEVKEGLKEGTGGAVIGSGAVVGTATTNPGIGAAAGVTTAGAAKSLGKIEKCIGKLTGEEQLETMGEAHDEGATEGVKDVVNRVKGFFD